MQFAMRVPVVHSPYPTAESSPWTFATHFHFDLSPLCWSTSFLRFLALPLCCISIATSLLRHFATSLCVLRFAILHRCIALWHCTLAALCGPRHITSPSLLHFDIAMLLAQCRESHGQTQWALPALLPCCWLNVVSPMGRHDGCIQPYCQFASCRSHVVSPMGRHDDDHFLPVRFVSGLRNTSLLLHPHPPCPRNTSLLLPVPLSPCVLPPLCRSLLSTLRRSESHSHCYSGPVGSHSPGSSGSPSGSSGSRSHTPTATVSLSGHTPLAPLALPLAPLALVVTLPLLQCPCRVTLPWLLWLSLCLLWLS